MKNNIYDLIIIGTGSAGYPAGMYASRYKIKNLIIGMLDGGALSSSHRVENYPGIISSTGRDIMNSFKEHTLISGSEVVYEMVTDINKTDNSYFLVKTTNSNEYLGKKLIIATGNEHKHLNITGEEEFLGKGVSYCATCDGMFFKNRTVVVVGGGNTALSEALYLSEITKKVYLIHRSSIFRAEDSWIDSVKAKENIEIILNSQLEEILGDNLGMTGVKLVSGDIINADGIFIAIGTTANTKILDGLKILKDEEGCILVDKRQESSVKGLYAAGDITTNSNKFKQTIMSAAEGCLAANSVHEDLIR